MTTNMLGAETGQLEALASRLGQTGAEIDGVQHQTQSTADAVVADMETSFARAMTSIENSMHQLRATVDAAHGQLGDTTWTGANAATFHAGYGDFNTAMVNFESAVHDAYAQFDAQMRSIADTIVAFQAQVTNSLAQAHVSTDSMQLAVVQQQANLESAMNTGISFG